MNYIASDKPVTLHRLADQYAQGEKIATLTAYDASFAALLDRCGIDMILVGDSLGNVIQGQTTTLPVTLEHMIYHTEAVARGAKRAFIASDMPWGSYQESPEQALRHASRLIAAGAQMVKIEGGAVMAETVHFMTERGIPVWAHIGLTPQSVHALGGYRVQGKGDEAARRMKDDALALQQAGAAMLLLEMIPAALGQELTTMLTIPTIGIGAGVDCSGQILVLHDMLGIYPGKTARFVRNFLQGAGNIDEAVRAYVQAVKNRQFPATEHTY